MEYKLRDWIPLDKLDWGMLSLNLSPGAIEKLEQNPEQIAWWGLSENPNPKAIEMIEKIH